jgi:hypothetical protein
VETEKEIDGTFALIQLINCYKVFLRIIFHFEIRIRSRSRGLYPCGPKHGKRLWTYRWSAYTRGGYRWSAYVQVVLLHRGTKIPIGG